LKGAFFTSAIFSGILGGILLLAFLMPERVIPSRVRDRYSFEFGVITGAKDFVTQLKSQIDGSSALLFESYGLASLVHYEFGRHRGQDPIPDFGVVTSGSRFGRVFDFTVDWNSLQGKKISMIKTGSFDRTKYSRTWRAEMFFSGGRSTRFSRGVVLIRRSSGLSRCSPSWNSFTRRNFPGNAH
jgi:hypothetical protein